MPLKNARKFAEPFCACALAALSLALAGPALAAQTAPPQVPGVSTAPTAPSFLGSVTQGKASTDSLDLSLDEAMQRGLRSNLGLILSNTQTAGARAQRMSQLQELLPSVDFKAQESLMQVDLAAEGLRISGFPTIIGPFGYTDLRASLTWSLVDLPSLVGNAYLVVVADETRVESVQAQVVTAKISLDQAVANHEAGTAPLLDELRSRVDYQSLQQQLIFAQNSLEKDKLALARAIGLPLEQKFNLTDKAPYAAFDQIDIEAAIRDAHANRKDLAAMVEQTKAAEQVRKEATDERLPKVQVAADYGDIGVNVRHSHGTGDAQGALTVPVFEEFSLRGRAEIAQSQLDTQRAQLSDKQAQVEADVRDVLLDIASAQKQVEVARSSVDLANEVLNEAQQRYANGVSDNLAVSEAVQSVAQANDQYVASLYRHNIAKLSLARALGASQNYKIYLGGK